MYYTKYDLSFQTIHNVPISVEIQVDGYTGNPIVRKLGAPPVLKTQRNGRIISTSIELQAQCEVFGEFSEFYTSDPRHFLVEIGRGDDGEGETRQIWCGYVTPEIYSEPYIAPPYDVRIYANDGLGELKLYDWTAVGRKNIAETLKLLLSATGADYSYIRSVTKIKPTSGTPASFFDDIYIDLDYLAGKNYYDVLQVLLESIDADIMQYGGDWVLVRETDATPKAISPITSPVNLETVFVSATGSSSSALYNVVNTIGKMGVADLWPVGYMTRSIEPAKKKVVVTAPWHMANAFDNPNFQTNDAWSFAGTGGVGGGSVTLGTMVVGAASGTASQTFTLRRLTKNLKVTVRAAAQWVSNSYLDGKARGVGVWARYQVTRTSEIKYYSQHGNSSDWEASYNEPDMQRVDIKDFGGSGRDANQELTFTIPSPGINEEVFLQVCIMGYGVIAYTAALTIEDNGGYKDEILINNGARGDAGNVEITGGRMTSDNITAERFYGGVLVNHLGAAVYSFDDSTNSDKDFMSINALNRALSVAVPRIKITGRFNVPETMIYQPILVKDGSTNLLVKSFEWDLYNDEIQIEALSLPAASMTVTSETITSL